MKLRSSFELRDICGEQVLIPSGIENIDFNKLITLNETAADIYRHFAEREFSTADVVAYVLDQYEGVTPEMAATDAERLVQNFAQAGILE